MLLLLILAAYSLYLVANKKVVWQLENQVVGFLGFFFIVFLVSYKSNI